MHDNVQFRLRPWEIGINALLTVTQEKYSNERKNLYYDFMDIEKAFDKGS